MVSASRPDIVMASWCVRDTGEAFQSTSEERPGGPRALGQGPSVVETAPASLLTEQNKSCLVLRTIAQLIICLPHKHEGPRSNPSTHIRSLTWWYTVVIPALER